MAKPAQKLATYEDLFDLPENLIAPDTAWFETVPDWVCEISSPATASDDHVEKMPLYARMGVKHVWLVDPALRTLEAYENRQGQWLLLQTLADDARVALAPFDAVEWDLGVLWAD